MQDNPKKKRARRIQSIESLAKRKSLKTLFQTALTYGGPRPCLPQLAFTQMVPFSFWRNRQSTTPPPSDGEPGLFFWGSNYFGQLGNNSNTDSVSPIQLSGSWSQISIGQNHSGAIRVDSTLWAWGENYSGRLGNGDTINTSSPVQVAGSWSQVAFSYWHSGAIRTDGTLWMWGDNYDGSLGIGSVGGGSSVPVQILGSWQQISTGGNAGSSHSGAIRSDGTLWMWGNNGRGQIGDGSNSNANLPIQISGNWSQISLGGGNSGGIRDDGTLWVWGNKVNIPLGAVAYDVLSPVQVPGSWSQVSMGVAHSGAIRTDGTLWMWGNNISGQIGNGQGGFFSYDVSSPVQISGSWSHISLGHTHTAAIRNDNSLWTWGNNGNGQLGNTGGPAYLPAQVAGTWGMIAAGGFNSGGFRV